MKEVMDATAVGRVPDPETFGNRKLIRPSLARSEQVRAEQMQERRERAERTTPAAGKKTPPPEQTHAENFYYQKQMQAHTPMVVVLQDGEEIHGVIEWYDRGCIKLNRAGGQPNLMIYKTCIKYLYKAAEGDGGQ